VLATIGVEDGWWEAVVIGLNGEMLNLRWRDFPGERTVLRRRSQVALLAPASPDANRTRPAIPARVPPLPR
jgi:hypothetical protein